MTDVEKLHDRLDEREFEMLVADIWSEKGWQTETTQKSNDGGIDVIAVRGGEKQLLQAKFYAPGNRVSVREVREYAGLFRQEDDVDGVSIVTTGGFTDGARDVANDAGVDLVGGDRLVEQIKELNVERGLERDMAGRDDSREGDRDEELALLDGMPDSAEGLQEATVIAKTYAEFALDGSWKGVTSTRDWDTEWKIKFKVKSDDEISKHNVKIKKDSGDIVDFN